MNLAKRLTRIMVNQGIIKQEEQAIYDYGLRQGFWMVVNFATTLLLGFWLSMLPQCLIFLVAYMVLRTFAGGYHARTPIRCYLAGGLLTIVALLMIKYGAWNTLIGGVFVILAGSIVVILAPVEDSNKPLDNIERVIYGRKVKIIVVLEVGITLFAKMLGWTMISSSIAVAICLMAGILILGKANNQFFLFWEHYTEGENG